MWATRHIKYALKPRGFKPKEERRTGAYYSFLRLTRLTIQYLLACSCRTSSVCAQRAQYGLASTSKMRLSGGALDTVPTLRRRLEHAHDMYC